MVLLRTFVLIAVCLLTASPAWATWSVIAIDRETGMVVIASATCAAILKQDPQVARRQFGIVDLEGRSAGFSGESNGAVSLDQQGQVDGTGIHYSIQSNILASEAVVSKAGDAFTSANGTLTDRVMAAIEAADAAGGDSRCSCDRGPKVNAPCTTKTAQVADILEAAKGDANGESYNDGKYSLSNSATDQDIKPDEDANPVRTLRMRYDRAMKR